jgi:hypothetical protein
MMTNKKRAGMVTKEFFLRSRRRPGTVLLWELVQHVRAVLPRRPCLASHRRAPPVQVPPSTGKASAVVRMMTRCSQL